MHITIQILILLYKNKQNKNILGIFVSFAQADSVNVQITNLSPYINPSLMKNLFEKYVTHAAKYNKIGVGLGLYLSKQIINEHNGEISAKSFEENKNIFEFTIPYNLNQ